MFYIRLADRSDMKKVFALSNNELVRENSFNKNFISWDEHVKWFTNRIENAGFPFYIVENKNGDFIAQVRFDKKEDDIVISISISEDFRGKGLASDIIKTCIKKSGFKKVVAYIKDNNTASIKSFEKAEFVNSHLLKYIYLSE